MIGLIAIGALLVEYMNDGTIYNRAFNTLCIITLGVIMLHVFFDVWHIVLQDGRFELWLSVFNNLRRSIMIFLFTFFAYDSAKRQLKRENLKK
jgi:DMSO/TMAO reductase YedYZ heme-binding membrane subunit